MYRLELHCHTSEVSACAQCPAETLILKYRRAGYHGLVSTNHINRATFARMEEWPWQQKVDHFMRGFELIKKAAPADFDVLLGCEINLTPVGWSAYIPNDFLIYGVTEDWLRKTGDMRVMTLEELSQSVREAGLLIVHAHPFRCGTVMENPLFLDGYEVFNGNLRHDSHNDLTAYWCKRNKKIPTSGSDFHRDDDPPCGGIETQERVRDNAALLRVLRAGQYRLIQDA